jgi:hypothetical protein
MYLDEGRNLRDCEMTRHDQVGSGPTDIAYKHYVKLHQLARHDDYDTCAKGRRLCCSTHRGTTAEVLVHVTEPKVLVDILGPEAWKCVRSWCPIFSTIVSKDGNNVLLAYLNGLGRCASILIKG